MVLSARPLRLCWLALCLVSGLAQAQEAEEAPPMVAPPPALDTPPDLEDEDPGERDQGDGADQDQGDRDFLGTADTARPYQVSAASGARLKLDPPRLPDLRDYTVQRALARQPRRTRGQAQVASALGLPAFKTFMSSRGRLLDWAPRQHALPRAIFIRDGEVTPAQMAQQLPREYFAQTAPGVYVARLPIDITPGASLRLDASVKDFRLSQDRGSFLINEGVLLMHQSRLRAWNEARDAPAQFRSEREFRPFLISWGGSQTYVLDSVIAHLGYAASKSYGVSLSQFPPSLAPQLKRSSPRGWLIGSEFYDNWYGFYCYEAEDLAIVGNDYHDNIHYGIDPHDRSRRLIIAGNKAYRTRDKHGIIVSREVDDSWIINNEAYDNALSGIVVDRNSLRNVLADNRVYRNRADGITIYESPGTLIWRNLATANAHHGIRVRNSTAARLYDNVAVGNGLSGIYGHIKDLAGTGRNIRLDPFHQRISMVVVGGQLVSNGSSPIGIDQPLSLEVYGVDLRAPQRQLGIKFTGVLGAYQEQVLDILLRRGEAVVVRPQTGEKLAQAQP